MNTDTSGNQQIENAGAGVGRCGVGRREAPPERDISSYTPHSYQPTMVAGGCKTRVDQTGARLSRKRKRGRRAHCGAAMNNYNLPSNLISVLKTQKTSIFCVETQKPLFSVRKEPKVSILSSEKAPAGALTHTLSIFDT